MCGLAIPETGNHHRVGSASFCTAFLTLLYPELPDVINDPALLEHHQLASLRTAGRLGLGD